MAEFCCGFSLRTKNLILIWSVLILESFHSLLYLTALFVTRHLELDNTPQKKFFPDVFAYYLLWSITGIIISILGLKAIYKKKPKFLNAMLWYFCYGVVFNLFRIVVMTILTRVTGQSQNRDKLEAAIDLRLSPNDLASLFVFGYSLCAAIFTYFAFVVKSYRDKMMMKIQTIKPSKVDTSISMKPIQKTEGITSQEIQQISNDCARV